MNFETARNIVAVVAPLIALYIAWRGLSTWNRQLRGTRDSDLSRRILVALYKVETMIRQIRSPFVEYRLPSDASHFDREANNKAWAKHYEDQWKALAENLAELRAASLEAKAVWDKNFIDDMHPFFAVINELHSHLSEHIQWKLNPHEEPIYDKKETRSIVYGTFDDKDEFGKKMKESIEQIDERVRRYLTPRRSWRKRLRRQA